MKKNYNILFLLLGIFLPMGSMLLGDWYKVSTQNTSNFDMFGWVIFSILCFPFLARGIYGVTKNKGVTVLLTIIGGLCIAAVSILILLNFHFLIGGSK